MAARRELLVTLLSLSLAFVGAGIVYYMYTVEDREKKKALKTPTNRQSIQTAVRHIKTVDLEKSKKTSSISSQSNGTLSKESISCLLRSLDDDGIVEKVLVTLSNSAAFTDNQNLIRECGGLVKIMELLSHQNPLVRNSAVKTLTNLSMNTQNQHVLKDCIPQVISMLEEEEASESLVVSCLQFLTNMSVLDDWHNLIIPASTSFLIKYITPKQPERVKIQGLKLLVNLSCNDKNTSKLVDPEVLKSLNSFLTKFESDDCLLRVLTCLRNILANAQKERLDYSIDLGLKVSMRQKLEGVTTCGHDELIKNCLQYLS